MVTILPKENDWSDAFQAFGSGLAEGYTNRSDENALRKSIETLPKDASPRQILDAITNTRTYSPRAKQDAFKNYLGVAEFEELQKKNSQQQKIQKLEDEINRTKSNEKLNLERGSARALIETSELSDDMKKKFIDDIDRGELSYDAVKEVIKPKKTEAADKKEEKQVTIQNGLKTIARMRELGKKGNLGRGSGFFKVFGGEAAKDFGEYQQLGKSLIQLSTNIPIRNRQEFETLAHGLYDPTVPDSEREGMLNALETIVGGNLEQPANIQPANDNSIFFQFVR